MGDFARGEGEGEGDCEDVDEAGPQVDICMHTLDVARKGRENARTAIRWCLRD